MRVAFFGSAPIAEHSLCALIDGEHDVAVIFTQPDRPAGRGGHMQATAVKQRAEMMGIPVEQPETLKDGTAADALRSYNVDCAVVVAYGHLIPPEMLQIPRHGFINLHASLLPKFRGAAPVPHAILAGDNETGVTVFRLNERWDAGDILDREHIPIHDSDTSASILNALAPIGARLILKVIGELEAGWVQPVPQLEAEATRAPKMKKEDGLIHWHATPSLIDRQVRAYQPWPLAYTYAKTGRKQQRLSLLEVAEDSPAHKPATPGTLLVASAKDGIVVQCGEHKTLRILRLKPEGKRDMTAEEFMRGARLEPGQTLG